MLQITIPADSISDMINTMELSGLADDIADHFWAGYHDVLSDTVTAHPNVIGNLAYLLNLLQEGGYASLADISEDMEYLDKDQTYSELKEDLLATISLPQDQIRVRVLCIFEDLDAANEDARRDYESEMEHQEELRSWRP